MNDARRQAYRDRIIDEAAEWFARMQDGELTAGDRAAFAEWLAASPEHVREYLGFATLHDDIGDLSSVSTIDALIGSAGLVSDANVIALTAAAAAPKKVGQRKAKSPVAYAALAAGLASVALIAVWGLRAGSDTTTLATGIGEQKSLTLPDGSVVALNAVSKIRVEFTDRYRDIRLASGEALFDVAKNARRPFRVLADDSVIQAVGTRFNVRHRDADTTVTVVEGKVAISKTSSATPVLLAVGQQLVVTSGAAGVPAQTDLSAATAWRERRLVFDSQPLSEVVAEFNLYNETPMTILDSKLAGLKVSGAFYANDPRSFALFLEEARLAVPRVSVDGIGLSAPQVR